MNSVHDKFYEGQDKDFRSRATDKRKKWKKGKADKAHEQNEEATNN